MTSTMENRFVAAIDEALATGGFESFFRWFSVDDTSSLDECARLGFFDFATAVLRPPVPQLLGKAYEKTALEIGVGGGRLLRPAAQVFRQVIGVDVHSRLDLVAEYLRSEGITNFHLLRTDGRTLPVADASVDFVFSFIVFIHLASPGVFESYVREIARVLRPGGCSSLYYGRPLADRVSQVKDGPLRWLAWRLEPVAETLLFDVLGRGYRSWPEVRANSISLAVTRRQVRSVARRAGFSRVLVRSWPHWRQAHLVLVR